jgi:predicted kinase
MEMVLFIGIQATGKSSFYRQRFFRTHVRVNLDMLKTRHRESLLINACLEGKTPFVVENTNVTREQRAHYILQARNAGFRIIGYFFESSVKDALERNRARPEADRVPVVGIFTANKRLELPIKTEGFDDLYFVRLTGPDAFSVEQWKEDVGPAATPVQTPH